MPVLMNTFWSDLGVVSGNTSATNQYDLWKGITFNDGFVCASQYDFFTHLGTNRYEFFKSYNSVDSNIIDEYTFYQNTSDPNIYDYKTFYEYAGQYLIPAITPTPTPTNTPTPSLTPQVQWNAEGGFYAGYSINSNNWFEIGYPVEGYLTFSTLASNGTRWAATGRLETGNLNRTFYSNNGSTWITGNNSPFSFMASPLDLTSNGDMFVLGGSSTYAQILSGGSFTTIGYSYDGITYSAGTVSVESGRALPQALYSTAFNGDMWIGVGTSTGTTANRTVMINSYDGINWSGITNTLWTGTTLINSIAYGNGRWVAVSNIIGNGRIAISYDGFNWSASTNAADSTIFGTFTSSAFLNNVIWFNDKFIATANASTGSTHTVCYSYDGFEWFPATSTKTLISSARSIASNKSDFVMIGGAPSGAIYQSPDGINWSANTTDQSVVFNNNLIARLSNKKPEQQAPNPSQTPSQTPTNTETPTQTPTPTSTPLPNSILTEDSDFITTEAGNVIDYEY